MTLRFGSVCSGIEAASAAWHPLGWQPAFFSEIDAFPRAVLAHHYPHVPLHGDFTTIREGQYAAIDVLVGGTPCQSFSVAGLRAGLDDERGNLALEFCRLARRLRPRWVVWENVPGVLSLDGGRAFASILGGLAECGYGLAYRVLDAQFVRVDGFERAVPQRRRRVFVVGHLGDWRRAAAVLFERESMSGHPAPRREAWKVAAPTLAARTRGGGGLGTDFDCDGGLVANDFAATLTRGAESQGKGGYAGRRQEDDVNLVAHTLNAKGGAGRGDSESETFLPVGVALRGRDEGATAELTGDVMTALRTGGGGGDKPHVLAPVAALPLLKIGKGSSSRGDGPNGAGVGGVGDPMFTLQAGAQHGVAVCFDETQITSADNRCNPQPGDPCHPLARGARPPALAFNARQDPDCFHGHTGQLDTDGSTQAVMTAWRVRRLMPVECERLQGFPDGYTAIPYRGKPTADGPRYKALGNSMAVNVMRWIGQRIEMVETIGKDAA